MSAFIIKEYFSFSDELLDCLVELERAIFEDPHEREHIQKGITNRNELIALVAFDGTVPVGFKVGYLQTPRVFYSWIGGVVPEYRGKGIARDLMVRQHELVKERGFSSIQTHTSNRFKEMLIFNIREGFEITGTSRNLGDDWLRIILEKQI